MVPETTFITMERKKPLAGSEYFRGHLKSSLQLAHRRNWPLVSELLGESPLRAVISVGELALRSALFPGE